jgi:hypothetical protein
MFLLIAALLAPLCGRAWGIVGHAAIADIAEAHLTPAALAEMRALLADEGFEHLDQVASWADEIRKERPEASPWHYVDIPLTASSYDAGRDCANDNCVIGAIARLRAVLGDRGKPAAERREALKFLVHFIGDLQQPLHGTENAGDHGGNKVLVTYFGQTTGWGTSPLNLHALWDVTIIERHIGAKETYGDDAKAELRKLAGKLAQDLDRRLTAAEVAAAATDLDPVRWAMESHDLAASTVYPGVVAPGAQPPATPVALGEEYDRRAWPVVERRLQQGGLRLAAVLNATIK